MGLQRYGFELDFLPVGTGAKSGDAISMRIGLPGTTTQTVVVIDGGTLDSGRAMVEHIQLNYDYPTRIENLVSTHPDSDHVSGLREVLDAFDVGTLWIHQPWLYADLLIESFKYRWTAAGLEARLKECFAVPWDLCQTATARGIALAEPYQGTVISGMPVLAPSLERYLALVPKMSRTPAERLGESIAKSLAGVARSILSVFETWSFETLGTPQPGDTSSTNETSVVMFGDFGEQKILLTADAGVEALEEAFDYSATIGLPAFQPNLVQIPHHGSRRNISPRLLDRLLGPIMEEVDGVQGGWAVASASAGDEHHPRRVVQNAFRRRGYLCAKTHGGIINYRHLYPLRQGLAAIAPEPFHTAVEQ